MVSSSDLGGTGDEETARSASPMSSPASSQPKESSPWRHRSRIHAILSTRSSILVTVGKCEGYKADLTSPAFDPAVDSE